MATHYDRRHAEQVAAVPPTKGGAYDMQNQNQQQNFGHGGGPRYYRPAWMVLANLRSLLPATAFLVYLPIYTLIVSDADPADLGRARRAVLYTIISVFAVAAGITSYFQLDKTVKYRVWPGTGGAVGPAGLHDAGAAPAPAQQHQNQNANARSAGPGVRGDERDRARGRDIMLNVMRFLFTTLSFTLFAYCLREPFLSDEWWSPKAAGALALAAFAVLLWLGREEPRFLQPVIDGAHVPPAALGLWGRGGGGGGTGAYQPVPAGFAGPGAGGAGGAAAGGASASPANVSEDKRRAAWAAVQRLRNEVDNVADLLLPDSRGHVRLDLARGPGALSEAPADPDPTHGTEPLLVQHHLTPAGRGLYLMAVRPLQEAIARVDQAFVNDRDVQMELRGPEVRAAAEAIGTPVSPAPARELLDQLRIACGLPAATHGRPVSRVGIADLTAAEQRVRYVLPRARDSLARLADSMEPRWTA